MFPQWSVASRLTVNEDLCEMLSIVGSRPNNIEYFGQSNPVKDSCRYLGVNIDKKVLLQGTYQLCFEQTQQTMRCVLQNQTFVYVQIFVDNL